MTRENYRVCVPEATSYDEVFNTDDVRFGGSGVVNKGAIRVKNVPDHDMKQSIVLTVPPLAAVYLKGRKKKAASKKTAAKKNTSGKTTAKKQLAKAESKPALKASENAEATVRVQKGSKSAAVPKKEKAKKPSAKASKAAEE